ncbi:hypothetical protein MJH54_29690, partial [Salmonella enterica subsp. enterica serovar Montevideo]|nr:hypothetical protein [Salmonella enterica subsp. enterica serovar Montevideo]
MLFLLYFFIVPEIVNLSLINSHGQVIEEQEVISPSMLALQELQETTGAALYETMEEIGMALSGK